jgi:glycerol-3-phosphate dehydrogenase
MPEILIVGGGINGAGVFRDLAAQGVPSLLVDKADFASGASAAPTRLIHGGLRYLETAETDLVRESIRERNLLLKNAHHFVYPQPVWVPINNWFAGTLAVVGRFFGLTTKLGPKGGVPLKIGLLMYDMFDRKGQIMPRHRVHSSRYAYRQLPILKKNTKALFEFYDARISHPERLVMELIGDAEAECSDSIAIPYLSVDGCKDNGLQLVDVLTCKKFTIRPKIVVNATGGWVDNTQIRLGHEGGLMGGTRGIHLVLRKPELTTQLKGRMLYFETRDCRACAALPLDETHVYVGTTDIRVDDPDDRQYSKQEVDYLFDALRDVAPREQFSQEDIVFIMSGIRPLPAQDTESTGQISRGHRLDVLPARNDHGFVTLVLVGGKWTTYRAFAQQICDTVLERIGQVRQKGTHDIPVGGARDLPATEGPRKSWIRDLALETNLDIKRCTVLCQRYGAKAQRFADHESRNDQRFESFEGYTPAEIELICLEERVTALLDVVMRRTLMVFEGRVTLASLNEVATVAGRVLGWDDAKRDQEITDAENYLGNEHGVRFK